MRGLCGFKGMSSSFVHLRVHTEYSIVDGLTRIDPLMKAVVDRGMNAVAVTDYCNLFAAVKVFTAALSCGVKPILGCDLPCRDATESEEITLLPCLCLNETGYRNLTRLVSRAYLEGQYQGKPYVQVAWLATQSEGLIALSGARAGAIGKALLANDEQRAYRLASEYASLFPDRFYLEIQRTGRADEARYNAQIVRMANALNLPLVATNDVRFLDADQWDAHEARVCIHEGYTLADKRRIQRDSAQQYLRSAREMAVLFHDLPGALANTVAISKRCTVNLVLDKHYLPSFPITTGENIETYLSRLSHEGLRARLQIIAPKTVSVPQSVYEERLNFELGVINAMGFAGYFLVVADFIQWAKENGVPVGPGRGSGAGSLVAYALKITDLDPLQYDLLFERFLNPERVSMPDFDIDFCMEGRDRVIEYVAEKYGRMNVSQIITFGTMAAKAVVRDVGRVLGHPYTFVDTLAKLIPFELGITLSKAMIQEEELQRRYDEEEDVKALLDLAMVLEGVTRNAGKHAGGVVIAPTELTDFTALYCEQGASQLVSQFDKDDVEAVGLVKFDFLGLRTLTIIDWALQTIHARQKTRGEPLTDISLIPLDDPATFTLLKACQTTAVFQLESRGMKELIQRLQPDSFEEIIALVALFRPGPLQSGMVDDFIDRKHGRAVVDYAHPDLEPILKPTYGVILYQEQVMQIAQVLANYTLGAADMLRRAMGKKKPEEMAKQRAIFTQGAITRGVDGELASAIFDLMEKFAGYGFNKSHSAAYALIAYQTAWLKANYPSELMAAVLSADMDNTDKVVHFINECRSQHLVVMPPSINQSEYRFTVQQDHSITYGLGAIKGVGESAITAIVQARHEEGLYLDLFDFCTRVDLRKVNRRVLEALIKSGAMDGWGVERAVLDASVESALALALQTQKNKQSGQFDLFSQPGSEPTQKPEYLPCPSWPLLQRLEGEKSVLGFFLTGHPTQAYRQELGAKVTAIAHLVAAARKKVWICALVTGVKRIVTKKGKKMTILTLEEADKTLDVVVFSELEASINPTVQTGEIIVVEGEVSKDTFSGGVKMQATQICRIEQARSLFARCLTLTLSADDKDLLASLQALLAAHPGVCPVQMEYAALSSKALLQLPASWNVSPSEDLLHALKTLLDEKRVWMCY